MNPLILISSSVEGLNVARAIQENLEFDANCRIWDQGVFTLSKATMASLLEAVDASDYAIAVLTPDDVSIIRSETHSTVRDNLIFELGLFIGRLSLENVFFVVPRNDVQLHLPTDLLGITPGTFDASRGVDILSSLGPFCNKVRRQISKAPRRTESKSLQLGVQTSIELKEAEENIDKSEQRPYPIMVGDEDLFFYDRLRSSFPGVRGLQVFDDPRVATKRLLKLLEAPLVFSDRDDSRTWHTPIWWFSGHSNMHIESVAPVSETKILIDRYEMVIKRVAVIHFEYYNSLVYVEVDAENPTGLYDISEEKIEEYRLRGKRYTEEYGVYKDHLIKREEYDDAAAVIDGELVDTFGALLRIRNLTPFNFIITGSSSAFNSMRFDNQSAALFPALLQGKETLEQLEEIAYIAKKRDYYE